MVRSHFHTWKVSIDRGLCEGEPGDSGAVWRTLGDGLLAAIALVPLAGCPAAAPVGDEGFGTGDREEVVREIEAADIVRVEGGHMFIANPFTGFRVIDISDIDHPVMKGRLPLAGRGVELFVRDNVAFVFTSADFFRCGGTSVGFENSTLEQQLQPDYTGSRVWVIDLTDAEQPALVTTLDFDGYVSATRRVGDVIYAAGNGFSSFAFPSGAGAAFVTSLNISDPANVTLVETESFFGSALDVHTTTSAMYIVGDDPDLAETTLVTYVDITDPAGQIQRRDQFRVPGHIANRFYVDESAGSFRIATEELVTGPGIFARVVALYVYDVTQPDDVQRLARLPLSVGEGLRAVRFDGPRGYVVTFRRDSPLFVLDLSDPAEPVVAGELEVAGFSTQLVPLGERLLGVGFDNNNGVRPAVALFDVSDPARPALLSRVIVGEELSRRASSEAVVDEKAVRVIEDAGLVLLPFSWFDRERADFIDALQLISLESARLRERGMIEHRGLVRRANMLDSRLWVLSDVAFQSVNITNVDTPSSLASLDLIEDQELLDAGLKNCADSARFRGSPIAFGAWGLCGAVGIIPFLMIGAGGLALRLTVRSRPSSRCAAHRRIGRS